MAGKKKIEENRKAILDLLLNKAALKQDIAEDVTEIFKMFKKTQGFRFENFKPDLKSLDLKI